MPTVLFVSSPGGVGGSTRSLTTVLAHLQGMVRRVIAAPLGGSLEPYVKDRQLVEDWIPIGSSRPAQIAAAFRLMRWALSNRESLQAVHANGLSGVNMAAPASLAAGAPLVVWVHDGQVSPWTRRFAPWWRLLATAHWGAVSPTSRAVIAELDVADPDRVSTVPNPIDPAEVRAEKRATGATPTIAYLGGYSRSKGFELLPEVIERLADEDCRWLVVVHAWKPDADLWTISERLRAEPRVVLVTKTDDVASIFAQADIVFAPSLQESFGRIAAEAMANGVPVVASDLQAYRDLIGAGECGLLFPTGDMEAAAGAIRRLLNDAHLRRRLGQAGLARAEAFAPGPIVAKLAQLYGLDPSVMPSEIP